jgi:predicted N-formylglutamate amidohydrolase
VLVDNPSGGSPFLFVGDHAGNAIPAQLQKLGLDDSDLSRHIAWDIGVRELGRDLARSLDATFIHQHYSRLVIDCNRDPDSPKAIPPVSDETIIPANEALTREAAAARIESIHAPYQAEIARALDRRRLVGRPTILVALHSFTPTLGGVARPWHTGILYHGGDVRFARALLELLRARHDLCVGDNQPYQMDGTDFTIPHHAYSTELPYAEIEIRQDLLGDEAGIEKWRDILAITLPEALDELDV